MKRKTSDSSADKEKSMVVKCRESVMSQGASSASASFLRDPNFRPPVPAGVFPATPSVFGKPPQNTLSSEPYSTKSSIEILAYRKMEAEQRTKDAQKDLEEDKKQFEIRYQEKKQRVEKLEEDEKEIQRNLKVEEFLHTNPEMIELNYFVMRDGRKIANFNMFTTLSQWSQISKDPNFLGNWKHISQEPDAGRQNHKTLCLYRENKIPNTHSISRDFLFYRSPLPVLPIIAHKI